MPADDEIIEEDQSETSDIELEEDAPSGDVPEGLSPVGAAAYTALRDQHSRYKGIAWNVTHGKVIGEVAQTPLERFWDEQITPELRETHSDAFAEKIGEILSRGVEFVDFASLGPPDGKFAEQMAAAIRRLHESGNKVVVRILTGNIIGMPTDNKALLKVLTDGLPQETSVQLWIGSWRKGLSWNHSKIIAVDGKYLLQGGHNVWDAHYLKWNPVRDISMEAEGPVAQDGHIFINRMWRWISKKESQHRSWWGTLDFKPRLMKSRVGLVHWPEGNKEYPPMFKRTEKPLPLPTAFGQGDIAMISCGRYGELHKTTETANPSDSAIAAMLGSAEKSIKLSLQDFGPLALPLPTGPLAIPGGVWPKEYLGAIASAIYQRGVNVDIVLSAPNSIPADMSATEANYGNGWTCEDVASEIIKAIQQNFPEADQRRLSGLVAINLKVTYMRSTCGSEDWPDGLAANHAKFFIVDDMAYYLGSQNLYIADLAEWGLIVDNEEQTRKVLDEYWNKLWAVSFDSLPKEKKSLDVAKVLQGCGVIRTTPPDASLTDEQWEELLLKRRGAGLGGRKLRLAVLLKSASNVGVEENPCFCHPCLRSLTTMVGLTDILSAGSSDAYVRLRVVDHDGHTVGVPVESHVVWDGGLNPIWNEQFEFECLDSPETYTLKMTLLDKDSLLGMKGDWADWLVAEDELGNASMPLSELLRTRMWQHKDVAVTEGHFSDATVHVAFNTYEDWGS